MKIKFMLCAGDKLVGTTWVKQILKSEDITSFLKLSEEVSKAALKLEENAGIVE